MDKCQIFEYSDTFKLQWGIVVMCSAQLQQIVETSQKIVKKLRLLTKPQGTTLLDRWLMVFLCMVQLGPMASHQLQELPLSITMEWKHEAKTADGIKMRISGYYAIFLDSFISLSL